MKLLQTEIDINPGTKIGYPKTYKENERLNGCAVLQIANTTTQENAYTIRLRCEHPLWQDGWYALQGVPPASEKDTPSAGKQDRRGPHNQWLQIFVPQGGTRNVLILFNPPRTPDARAGRYECFIEVETQVSGTGQAGRRKDRLTRLPAAAIIRPFYQWSLDITPEQQRAGRFRNRGRDFEVVVTNEGNDWLYCDLQLPRHKDMLINAPTLRLAVPPAKPGEVLPIEQSTATKPGFQRTVPLRAITRMKLFRGELTPQAIPLTAVRVDAPSLPPPPDDPNYVSMGSVIAVGTKEVEQLPGDRSLLYCPPIPAKLTDFFSHSGATIRSSIMTVLALVLFFHLAIIGYERSFHDINILDANTTLVTPGGKIRLSGKGLEYPLASMSILNLNTGAEVPVIQKPVIGGMGKGKVEITVPKDKFQNGDKIKIVAERISFLPWLRPPLLPSSQSQKIQVGEPPKPTEEVSIDSPDPGPYTPGQPLTLTGHHLGSSGTVYFGLFKAKSLLQWHDEGIIVRVPTDVGSYAITVKPKDKAQVTVAGGIKVEKPPVVVSNGGHSSGTTGSSGGTGTGTGTSAGARGSGQNSGNTGGNTGSQGSGNQGNQDHGLGGSTGNGDQLHPLNIRKIISRLDRAFIDLVHSANAEPAEKVAKRYMNSPDQEIQSKAVALDGFAKLVSGKQEGETELTNNAGKSDLAIIGQALVLMRHGNGPHDPGLLKAATILQPIAGRSIDNSSDPPSLPHTTPTESNQTLRALACYYLARPITPILGTDESEGLDKEAQKLDRHINPRIIQLRGD